MQADPALAPRIEYLADRANEGALTEAEETEYEAYVEANNLLAVIQAEARQRICGREP